MFMKTSNNQHSGDSSLQFQNINGNIEYHHHSSLLKS